MNLPNYFLADLPAEATLSAAMIREAALTLKRNRQQYLAGRSTHQIVRLLRETAARWLQPEDPFRRWTLAQGPKATGFPEATLARGLQAFFGQITQRNLEALLAQDLGDPRRLDEMTAAATEEKLQQSAMVCGPELLAHITAGNVPGPALSGMVLGLLTRSAQFFKCARGTSFLPRMFAHSLHQADPKLAACLEIAEWPGGTAALEETLFAEADAVVATGTDETLAAIALKLPRQVRFLGYGHRVSFGYISQEILAGFGTDDLVAQAADDVVAWNQQGCLSPHLFYVESGGVITAEQFAGLLAAELERREKTEPRGALPVAEAALISSRRDFYRVRAAASKETCVWQSEGSTAWTVVYEGDPQFQTSCLNRFVYVKPVAHLAEALRSADHMRGKVSTVGLAAHASTGRQLATGLARWGVTRVCPLGQMQRPPLTWRHDGRPALGELLTWTNWEQ